MGKNIELNANQWLDFVFEGKNKVYGAYFMRTTSWRRHILATGIMLAFTIIVALVPTIISAIQEVREKLNLGNYSTTVELAKIQEQKVPEENIIKQEVAPAEPPPPLKSTIKFTPPEISDDEDVAEDDMMSQDKLLESKVQISIANIEGVNDINAVDIAELAQHKVIVQEKAEVFTTVEQMPQFPGGELALRKWLAEHTRYPTIMTENNIQGQVVLRFVVTKTGTIGEVQVLQNTVTKEGEQEAIRVVKALPKFIPGRHNGRAVPVWFIVPIKFKLE
jgi:protein TonB